MALKVFIIGSIPADAGPDMQGHFVAACEGIGETLAGAGHTLMVNKSKSDAADPHIVRGAAKTTKPTIVVHENPDYEAFRETGDQVLAAGVNWRRETVTGPREAVFLRTISQADVVVAIGGKYMTALIGYLAAMLEKPVLPLGRFGGAGAELLESFDRQLRDCLSEKTAGILNAPWSAGSGEVLLQALEDLTARNPFRAKARIWPVVTLLATILATLVGWVSLFVKPDSLTGFLSAATPAVESYRLDIATFVMLGLAVFLGTVLRWMPLFSSSRSAVTSVRQLLLDASKALIVVFGMILTYYYGGVLTSGKAPTVASAEDFQRVAINFSFIGLFAGLLLERAEGLLKEKLESVIKRFGERT